jgi:hypothetical protein
MQLDILMSNFVRDYIATQQRAIYNWYKSCHSDTKVVDIYSPQWQERVTSWYKWFVDNVGTAYLPIDIVKS